MMSILIVIVRYEVPLEESSTIASLSEAFRVSPDLRRAFRVLVWDNSPVSTPDTVLPFQFDYQHSRENLGVSGAYNGASDIAATHGCPWMLLFDQDTTFSPEMLFTMLRYATDLLPRNEIAAIAPTVRVGDIVVSPIRQLYMRKCDYPLGEIGVAEGEAIAINSGCMLRVEALHAIGGFSSEFWLDFSDLYVFHMFFRKGLKVWRAADATCEHEMSIMDYDHLMSPGRYRNLSMAETAFNDLYRGRFENAIQTLRLFARSIKQRFKYENPEFSRIAWQQWLYRLTTTKRHRVAIWKASSLVRK